MAVAISFNNVTKSFRKNRAIKHVSFELQEGRSYGLIGPNRSGKTTLLKLVLGLYYASSGDIRVLGLDPRNVGNSVVIKQRVAYLSEEMSFYPELTSTQLHDFSQSLYSNWDKNKFYDIHSALNFPLNKKIKMLSYAEKVKLAFAVSIAQKPEVLLLDNPTSGLDTVSHFKVLQLIHELVREKRTTILFSSEVCSDVEELTESILFLNDGRLIESGTLNSLKGRFTKVSFMFDSVPSKDIRIDDARHIYRGVREWVVIFENKSKEAINQLAERLNVTSLLYLDMNLEDLFIGLWQQHERDTIQ